MNKNSSSINKNFCSIENIRLNPINISEAAKKIIYWASKDTSKYITLCNSHSLLEGARDPHHAKILNKSDINLPDGWPVAFLMRLNGFKFQRRVAGPDLMTEILKKIKNKDLPIYFYGSKLKTLQKIKIKFQSEYGLNNLFIESPSFKPQTEKENLVTFEKIINSKAKIIFVSLGCPKQERWMFLNYSRFNSVTIGVGAAFAFHANELNRAPLYFQKTGLEWAYRLMQEPKRLFLRYLLSGIYIFYLFFLNLFQRSKKIIIKYKNYLK